MPIEITFLDNGIGVYWFGYGDVSGEDLLDATKATYRCEQKFRPLQYALVDFISAENNSVQAEAITAKATMDANAAMINPDLVVALVASRDVAYGMIRMWEFFVDELGWKTKAFRSLSEAEEWIRESADIQSDLNLTGKANPKKYGCTKSTKKHEES